MMIPEPSKELRRLFEREERGQLTDTERHRKAELLANPEVARQWESLQRVNKILAAGPSRALTPEQEHEILEGLKSGMSGVPTVLKRAAPSRGEGRVARLWLRAGPYAALAAIVIAVFVGRGTVKPGELIGGTTGKRSFHCLVKGAVREEKGALKGYELEDVPGDYIKGYWMETYDQGSLGLTQRMRYKGKLCVARDPSGCTKWEEGAVFDLVYQCEEEHEPERGKR